MDGSQSSQMHEIRRGHNEIDRSRPLHKSGGFERWKLLDAMLVRKHRVEVAEPITYDEIKQPRATSPKKARKQLENEEWEG